MTKKSITVLYCTQQVAYWAATGGFVSFAVAYLTAFGFSAAQAGWVLFGAYLLSFLCQPPVAAFADRAGGRVITKLILLLSAVTMCCFLVIRFAVPALPVFGGLYLLGVMCLDMQIPLMNSLSVYYVSRGWKNNYGLGRGLGGFGFALATLGYGYLMEYLGEKQMPVAACILLAVAMAVSLAYPKASDTPAQENRAAGEEPSTLGVFFRRYKWYCASLLGVLFLAMYHAMTENYLIEIFRNLGGDSSNVGIALFIATATELPAMALFARVYKKLGSKKILLASAVFYIIKAALFIAASSVAAVYAAQLLQFLTYVLLTMVQVYYAGECTSAADMIKGQSVITAAYTLGCAVGNLLGGVLISGGGVRTMLYAGICMTAAGFAVFAATVRKALHEGQKNEVS